MGLTGQATSTSKLLEDHPDFIKLGPATLLLSTRVLRNELGFSEQGIRLFLEALRVPLLVTSSGEHISLLSLELALQRSLLPGGPGLQVTGPAGAPTLTSSTSDPSDEWLLTLINLAAFYYATASAVDTLPRIRKLAHAVISKAMREKRSYKKPPGMVRKVPCDSRKLKEPELPDLI